MGELNLDAVDRIGGGETVDEVWDQLAEAVLVLRDRAGRAIREMTVAQLELRRDADKIIATREAGGLVDGHVIRILYADGHSERHTVSAAAGELEDEEGVEL